MWEELQGIFDNKLALYIIGGLLLFVGGNFKVKAKKIEEKQEKIPKDQKVITDKISENQHDSNKELWKELNLVRERVATLEGAGGKKDV